MFGKQGLEFKNGLGLDERVRVQRQAELLFESADQIDMI